MTSTAQSRPATRPSLLGSRRVEQAKHVVPAHDAQHFDVHNMRCRMVFVARQTLAHLL